MGAKTSQGEPMQHALETRRVNHGAKELRSTIVRDNQTSLLILSASCFLLDTYLRLSRLLSPP